MYIAEEDARQISGAACEILIHHASRLPQFRHRQYESTNRMVKLFVIGLCDQLLITLLFKSGVSLSQEATTTL